MSIDYFINKEKKAIDDIRKELRVHIHEHAKTHYIPSPLKNQEAYAKDLEKSCIKSLTEFMERLKKGFIVLGNKNIVGLKEDELKFLERIFKGKGSLKNKKNLQQYFEISDESLLACYQCGKELFQSRNYRDAADVFLVLTQLNPSVSSFWLALGRAEEVNHCEELALIAYLMVLELDAEDLMTVFDCIRCLKKLNRLDQAEQILDQAFSYAEHDPHQIEFKKRALALKRKGLSKKG